MGLYTTKLPSSSPSDGFTLLEAIIEALRAQSRASFTSSSSSATSFSSFNFFELDELEFPDDESKFEH